VICLGCATVSHGSPFDPDLQGRAELSVENASFSDARLYLIWNETMQMPLGAVEAMSTRTWALPPRSIPEKSLRNGSFRLEARFLGTRERFTSPSRLLSDGEVWIWQLHNDMAFSSLVVR
jgi:hypothetical protein